jgi:CRP/FNR family transcriptional regulator
MRNNKNIILTSAVKPSARAFIKTKNHRIESILGIELFSSLGPDELQIVTEKMTVKDFKRGEIILCEEDTNEVMYILLDGEVKVIQTAEDGREMILAMHKSGHFFGELSLIDGRTSPASVVATRHSVIAIISKNNFFALIYSQPKVLNKLLLILCSRFRDSLGTIQMLNFNNALQRIKMLFIMLYEKHGKEENGLKVLNIKLTHQGLAEMSGMSRETVTRVIDRWQKDGDLTILNNKLIALNPAFFTNIKDIRVLNIENNYGAVTMKRPDKSSAADRVPGQCRRREDSPARII